MSPDNAIAPSAIAPPEGVDVLCPLCEYNLRGLAEPRCPECGHRSTWEELLNRPPPHRYLFEDHPKHNVWSFLATLFASLRPIKFWRSVKPVMPVRMNRLIAFGGVCAFAGLIGSGFGMFGTVMQIAQRNAVMRRQMSLFNMGSFNQAVVKRYGSIQVYQNRAVPPMSSKQFWINLWNTQLLSPQARASQFRAATLAVLWVPLTMLSLMVFRASMRQAKIRNGHVLRCVLYSAAPICFYGLYLIGAIFLISMNGQTNWGYTVVGYVDATYLACAGFLLLLTIRLMFAYRLYLRFHQAIATVIASQIMVTLILLKIDMALLGH